MRKLRWSVFLFFSCAVLFFSQTIQAVGAVVFQVERLEERPVIVLDAGHGGEDGGAVGAAGTLEKVINLQIALKLEKLLTEKGFRVVMIREQDQSVGDASLSTVAQRKRSDTRRRLEILEETGECLFLSIHQNFFDQSQYDGAQVFYSENRPESLQLAEAIRSSIVSSLQPENHRENKPGGEGIYLLKNSPVPAVLIECGFLSNPLEEQKLKEETYQQEMAQAICQGVVNYWKAQESSQ